MRPSSRLATSDEIKPPSERPLSPIVASGCCARIQDNRRRISHTACAVPWTSLSTSSLGNPVPFGRPRARGPCMGRTGSTTLRPRSRCRCQALKHHRVERGPSHLRAVDTDQPGPRLAVSQHQAVLAVVSGVAQPPFPARFAGMGLVVAVEKQPLIGAPQVAYGPDRDVGRRWGWGEEGFGIVEPALIAVKVLRRKHFAVDPFECGRVGRRPQQAEPGQHDFVAERLRRKRDGGPGHRKLVGLTIQVGAPGAGVEASGAGERAQHLR